MGNFILKPNQTMVPSFPTGKYYTKSEADGKFALKGGTGTLTLQTNGVNNGSQSLLNFVAGTNMTITDDGAGNVTFTASGGGGGGSGTVTSVTSATTELSIATQTTTPVITIVSAPKLTTARAINGVNFDGSADITVTAAAGTLTGTTLKSTVVSSSLTSVGTIATGVWNGTAIGNTYLANSSLTIGSTNISLGGTSTTLAGLTSVTSTTFAGALTGNASTATALATGRTISITGDIAYTSPAFDGSGNVTGAGTLATVNSNVGSFGSATQAATFTVNGKGLTTAAANVTITPAVGSITGLGTGVATWLATPSSANLLSAQTDKTGTGLLVFGTSPTLTTAVLGSSTATTQTPSDNSTKLATTAYVDNALLGQRLKEGIGAATTANLVGTYLNGTSGVGATFAYTATGVDTIDGTTLTLGMRVLLKNQTSSFQNGIYTVTTAGAVGVAGILTRATDFDQAGDIQTGDSVFVTAGTAQGTTTWAYNGSDNPAMGTDAITFAQTSGQGSFSSGNGIAITGTSIAIDTSVTVDKTTAQTLTNKTLTTPVINGLPTGTGIATANTASTIVARDGSNNFSAGTITAALTGNASTATALQNARTIWGQSFDGTGNISGAQSGITTMTGGANNMTITAGTGNSRTMALQTTTSGGTATTFLTGNADQSATFANTVTATTFVGALTGNASGSAATVTGAAQTAITSVGTLTGLTVSGTVSHTNSNPFSMTNSQVVTVALAAQTVGTATLTIPDFASVSDEFTFKTKAQTMSNKTFVAPALGTPASGVMTNVTGTATGLTSGITNALKSATTTVDVSAATAPTSGQVLTATGGSAATWQTPSSGGITNIAETVLGSAASSISVTSIPTGYRYLMIQVDLMIIGSATSTQRLQVRFNNISAGVYGHQMTSSSSTSVTSERGTDNSAMYLTEAANWLEVSQNGIFEGTYTVNQTSKQVTSGIWLTSCTGSGGLVRWTGSSISSKDVISVNGGLKQTGTYDITRIDILNDGGNLLLNTGSRVTVYGYN